VVAKTMGGWSGPWARRRWQSGGNVAHRGAVASSWVGGGPQVGLVCRSGTAALGRAQFNIQTIFQIFKHFKIAQYETSTYQTPKNSKLGKVKDKFKRNNFPFGKKFKFPTEFELKIQKRKPI
jgi:hypothetical protein